MRSALFMLTVIAGGACGPSLTIYHKTSPRRIDVAKRVTASKLSALARRRDATTVDVKLKRSSLINVRRIVHYNAAAIEYHASRNPLFELADMTLGWWLVIVPPFDGPYVGEPTSQSKFVWHGPRWLSGINPAQSWIGARVVIKPLSDADVFRDPPTIHQYAIHLPVPGVKLRYRVFDAAKRVIASGAGTTNVFGAVPAKNIGPQAVAVEVTARGETMLTPIIDDAPATSQPPK